MYLFAPIPTRFCLFVAAAIVQATTNLPSTNNNSGNAYYILGLSTLGVLLVMALMALAVLLLHPEYAESFCFSLYFNAFLLNGRILFTKTSPP